MTLVAALGLIIGVALGSLGGGGSILAVPVLAHLGGLSAGGATATSLVAVGASAAVGSIGHARAGHVRWGPAITFVVTAVPGSWAGSELNRRLDGDLLLLAFSALVLVAAWRMLTACPSCTRLGESRAIAEDGRASDARPRLALSGQQVARIAAAGTTVGFLTGLFGVGGGFVIVPGLTLALGLNMPMAIGTSLVVIVGNALVALAFRGGTSVDWAVATPFTVMMLVGSLAGSLLARRLPPTRSLRWFAGLLVLVAVGNAVAAAIALVA